MRCEQAKILLSQELDGELDVKERAALEQHLSGCPECQRIRQAYRSIDAEIAGLEIEPPASLEHSILDKIHNEPIPVRPRRRPMWGVGTAAAAAAVLALVIFGRTGLLQNTKNASADSAPTAEAAMDTFDRAGADKNADTEAQLAAPEEAWFEEDEAENGMVVEDVEMPTDAAYDTVAFDPVLWAQSQDGTVLILDGVTPEETGLTGGEEIADGAVSFRVDETQFRQLLQKWDGEVYGEGTERLVLLLFPEE